MDTFLDSNLEPIALTKTVKKSGCAAKLPAGELSKVLKSLPLKRPDSLIVGMEKFDDAALWDLGDGRLMVKTLDFFTPIVDDPVDFGRIAAANALSDVYAMGGTPALALTILAFPTAHLPMEMVRFLMAGAVEKIEEAGAALGGGHSIDDDTLKLGFSVTGFVDKNRAWTNAGAHPGDVLILTKALGTGTLISANKEGKAEAEWMKAAIQSMSQLNTVPQLLADFDIHAATDITGFGLAGHGMEMAIASGYRLNIKTSQLPVLPGALEMLKQGILNKAHKTNLDYTKDKVEFSSQIPAAQRWLCLDAQTSGGLLLAVSPEDQEGILRQLRTHFPMACAIGVVSDVPAEPFAISLD
ncbi:MAG: selenide, water dikinase SelD [Bdellovibrionaceae bacterium]|nr:selenide, water dikinase SelD [Bdellovibrionales bacterium]MCB9086561.1 selenide, water dikinase SelD [Pseudobdellovibrionaceae bacterium]